MILKGNESAYENGTPLNLQQVNPKKMFLERRWFTSYKH
jgi:hypothetical protein